MNRPSSFARRSTRQKEEGYVLLTMLVFVALLAITAAAMAPNLIFQLRRDREEELVHRGVQYSRGIRRYYKKFGRYPSRIEDLENSNNYRSLRRRYKDPLTGKDFKLLHVGDVKINFQGGLAGATPAGGLSQAGNQALVNQGLPGGAMGTRAGGIGLVGSPGGMQAGTPQTPAQGGDSASGEDTPETNSPASKSSDSDSDSNSGSSKGFSGPVFGGGAIVGVASANTDKTIREYNDKKHYNEWQFIYDPTMDRGGLLTAPGIPKSGNAGGNVGQPVVGPGGQQPGQGFGQPVQPTPQNPPPGNQGGNDNDDNN